MLNLLKAGLFTKLIRGAINIKQRGFRKVRNIITIEIGA